jgi:hypothetical protein
MDYIIGKRTLAIGYSWRVEMLWLYLIANSSKLVREGNKVDQLLLLSNIRVCQSWISYNNILISIVLWPSCVSFHAWYNVFLNIVFVYVCFGSVFSKGFLLIGCFCLRCIMLCSLSILLSIILKCFLLGLLLLFLWFP